MLTRAEVVAIEQEVLVRIVRNGKSSLDDVSYFLNDYKFALSDHKFIYQFLKSAFSNQETISGVDLLEQFASHGIKLLFSFYDAENIEEMEKEIFNYLGCLLELESEGDFSVYELCLMLENSSSDISSTYKEATYSSLHDAVDGILKTLAVENAGDSNLLTGLTAVDEATKGLSPGKLYVIGGEQEVGKSLLCQQIALRVAGQSIPVALVSMEMTRKDVARRFVTMLKGVECLSDKEMLFNAQNEFRELPISIIDDVVDVEGLVEVVNRCWTERGIKLVVIDYLQLISCRRHTQSKTDEVNEVIGELIRMKKDLDVPVLLISSVTIKNFNNRKSRMPSPADIKDTGQLAYDADCILFLWKPVQHEDDYYELIIAKMRDHPKPSNPIPLRLNREKLCFEEAAIPQSVKLLANPGNIFQRKRNARMDKAS